MELQHVNGRKRKTTPTKVVVQSMHYGNYGGVKGSITWFHLILLIRLIGAISTAGLARVCPLGSFTTTIPR
jgi:hypothetical protein